MTAKASQVGGDHYKDMVIQPIEYIVKNNLGFVEGAVVKYVSRWKNKGGIEDLRKARHLLELLIEYDSESSQSSGCAVRSFDGSGGSRSR